MNILILGCGQLGQALAEHLCEQHQVTVIARRERHFEKFHYIAQDIHQLGDIATQLFTQKFDYIFCIVSPNERTTSGYQHTYLDTAQPIFQALKQHNPQKVFFVSSTRTYGEHCGETIDDLTTPQPQKHDALGQILRASELVWQAYWQDKLCILRPSGLYQRGSERLQNMARNTEKIEAIHWTNRIHRHDMIGFMAHLITLDPQQIHDSYILSDEQPLPLYQILNFFREQLHLSPLYASEQHLPHSGKKLHPTRLQQSGYALTYRHFFQGQQDEPL